ncbi:hypothetical protein LIA77_00914 [Sarocladium implicatum]|nr:hypothetical protein LIA77_00914 [Sarocladium implicatum]
MERVDEKEGKEFSQASDSRAPLVGDGRWMERHGREGRSGISQLVQGSSPSPSVQSVPVAQQQSWWLLQVPCLGLLSTRAGLGCDWPSWSESKRPGAWLNQQRHVQLDSRVSDFWFAVLAWHLIRARLGNHIALTTGPSPSLRSMSLQVTKHQFQSILRSIGFAEHMTDRLGSLAHHTNVILIHAAVTHAQHLCLFINPCDCTGSASGMALTLCSYGLHQKLEKFFLGSLVTVIAPCVTKRIGHCIPLTPRTTSR